MQIAVADIIIILPNLGFITAQLSFITAQKLMGSDIYPHILGTVFFTVFCQRCWTLG